MIYSILVENSRQVGATRLTIEAGEPIDNCLWLVVKDNGPGIPDADRDQLFKPFYTTRRAAGGT